MNGTRVTVVMLIVVALATAAAAFARQGSSDSPLNLRGGPPPIDGIESRPVPSGSPGLPDRGAVIDPFETLEPATPDPSAPSADPMGDVDEFIAEGRRVAAERIDALTSERDELRARLERVEAALTKWQRVAGALEMPEGPLSEPELPPAEGGIEDIGPGLGFPSPSLD